MVLPLVLILININQIKNSFSSSTQHIVHTATVAHDASSVSNADRLTTERQLQTIAARKKQRMCQCIRG